MSSNKTKTLWGIVNQSRGSKKQDEKRYQCPVIRGQSGKVIDDPLEVCNIFNDYFLNIDNRNQNRSELRSLSAACTEFVRNFRDLSVLLGSARLCPHSFSPPRLITPLNSRREELVSTYCYRGRICKQNITELR
ncbi:hypothetical protein J6590_076590 [Homalodisca vitripennis]|nr:hypothetical protein J6590_076590 [Homalodisca vitripennis]